MEDSRADGEGELAALPGRAVPLQREELGGPGKIKNGGSMGDAAKSQTVSMVQASRAAIGHASLL